MTYNSNYIIYSCLDKKNLNQLAHVLQLNDIFYYTKITNDGINYFMKIAKNCYEKIINILDLHNIKYGVQLGLFDE